MRVHYNIIANLLLYNTYTGVNKHAQGLCVQMHVSRSVDTQGMCSHTQSPITLHLVCDLIRCIDNLSVSGTLIISRVVCSAAPPPRWLGTQTSIRSTRRNEQNKKWRNLEIGSDSGYISLNHPLHSEGAAAWCRGERSERNNKPELTEKGGCLTGVHGQFLWTER